jgi:prepilin-type N-terminal cleavage/methylation domain-containing protein
MNRKGFSLIELVVVIGIISILLALATLNFSQWQRKTNVEKETKELYADLMFIRQQAIVTGMIHQFHYVSANSVTFLRYSSENDALGTRIRQRNLPYAISKSSWSDPSGNDIDFTSRGMMDDVDGKALCISSDADPAYDSIVIQQSRISLGKNTEQGSSCDPSKITIQ